MSGINSTDPEYEDLQKTVECVREITRVFDDMTGRLRMERAGLMVLSEELAGSGGRGGANRGAPVLSAASARAFPELDQSLARRTAREKELVNAAAAFAQLLARWAQSLEARNRKQDQGHPNSIRVGTIGAYEQDISKLESARGSEIAQLYHEGSDLTSEEMEKVRSDIEVTYNNSVNADKMTIQAIKDAATWENKQIDDAFVKLAEIGDYKDALKAAEHIVDPNSLDDSSATFQNIQKDRQALRILQGVDLAGYLVLFHSPGAAVSKGLEYEIPAPAGVILNKMIGDQTADAIAARYPFALREVPIYTVGGKRVLDVLVLGTEKKIAIESKVGQIGLDDPRIRQQLARDWWLKRQGKVDEVIWEFTPSPITKMGGPDAALLEKLQKLGIKVKINK